MKRPEAEDQPESDAAPGAPHPRHALRLIGHAAAEAEMLTAYREGRLAHAWLIGGPEGIGKATLAWAFARFLFANPDPNARAVQAARDLTVDPACPAARHLAALAHPDFSLVRRVLQADKKRFYSEIRVDDVREALQVFQMSAAFGGWRICLVDCAEDLNRKRRQRAPEDDRGAAGALADSDRVASAGAGAADDSLALPPAEARPVVRERHRRGHWFAGTPVERGRPRRGRCGRRARLRLGPRGAGAARAGLGGGRAR